MSHHQSGQRDITWPVIDPKVLRLGVSKIRSIDSEWLHQFAANGEIAVFQTSDEPLSVLVPYALYQTLQAQLVGYHDALAAQEPASSAQSAAQGSSSQSDQSAALVPQGWREIADAPKDGSDVLTFGMAGLVVARWEDEVWRVYNYGYEEATVRKFPTHWMPLPAPPLSPDPPQEPKS